MHSNTHYVPWGTVADFLFGGGIREQAASGPPVFLRAEGLGDADATGARAHLHEDRQRRVRLGFARTAGERPPWLHRPQVCHVLAQHG